ncbi:hypothetical protein DFAR_2810006 [Desulfarculales bacterium]
MVAGGIHVILLPDEVFAHPAVDCLCVDEDENALPRLREALEQGASPTGIQGLWDKLTEAEFRN